MADSNNRDIVIKAEQLIKQVMSPDGSDLTILDGVSLQVNAAEALAILGASGSGKSTLLGLLAGLDLPSSGSVELLGTQLGQLDEDSRAKLRLGRVGFVFQSFQLMPGMSALENVRLPLQLNKVATAREQAEQLLDDVGLSARKDHQPHQLSGGEQQRVALARAFAGPPQILFADEPTGNLDVNTGSQIEDLLFQLRDRYNTALVLVTHDQALAQRCDHILHLDSGKAS